MTDLYLISGFLGAGKTTLIAQLLREAFPTGKTVLIENDFGEVSIDAALLRTGKVSVRELNAGCICCSLSGDFVSALEDVLRRQKPDRILIEPSGVGMLSDIEEGCRHPRIASLAAVRRKITAVDVKRCRSYQENFGAFFEDQIRCADVILLTRTEQFPDKIDTAVQLVQSLNPEATVLQAPLHADTLQAMLSSAPCSDSGALHEACGAPHVHAHETFQTVTIHTTRVFTPEALRQCLQKAEQLPGQILRAKGIVPCAQGFLQLQYVPGSLEIIPCEVGGSSVCVIGTQLQESGLQQAFAEA